MRVLPIIFFLLISQSLCAQKAADTFTIDIDARGSGSMSRFVVNIERSPDLVKIVYAVRDSLSNEGLKENKDYTTLLHQFVAANDANERDTALIQSIMHQFDSIEIASYSKDSLAFKPSKSAHYTKLINKIYSATTEQLENIEANRKRIVLDGTLFKIKIQSSSGSRIIYAHSPEEMSHPLLAELITETLDLYRGKNQNAFLDKRKTNGY